MPCIVMLLPRTRHGMESLVHVTITDYEMNLHLFRLHISCQNAMYSVTLKVTGLSSIELSVLFKNFFVSDMKLFLLRLYSFHPKNH